MTDYKSYSNVPIRTTSKGSRIDPYEVSFPYGEFNPYLSEFTVFNCRLRYDPSLDQICLVTNQNSKDSSYIIPVSDRYGKLLDQPSDGLITWFNLYDLITESNRYNPNKFTYPRFEDRLIVAIKQFLKVLVIKPRKIRRSFRFDKPSLNSVTLMPEKETRPCRRDQKKAIQCDLYRTGKRSMKKLMKGVKTSNRPH